MNTPPARKTINKFARQITMEKFELKEDIQVACQTAVSFPAGIQEAFHQLEKKLPNIDQRRVFGISYGDGKGNIIYKAAAQIEAHEDAERFALAAFVIRSGTYVMERVNDFMNNVPQIGINFQRMLKHPDLDTGSYCLEWYQGKDVLCMVRLTGKNPGT